MKKIVLLSILAALVSTLFMVACSKDEPAPATADAGYANPNNPFDEVGRLHNECLEILQMKYSGQRHSFEDAFQTLAEKGYGTEKYPSTALHNFALLLGADNPMKTLTDKMFREGRISENLYKAYNGLNGILERQVFTAELAQSIRDFESKIPDMGLAAHEAQRLYSTCSVARYSNAYWTSKKAGELGLRDRESFVEFCDIVAAMDGASGDDAALFSSMADIWFFFGLPGFLQAPGGNGEASPMRLPDLSWLFGHRWTPEEPCQRQNNSICSLSTSTGSIDDASMSGSAIAFSPEVVVMEMNGSALSHEFYELFETGSYHLEFDFSVPDDVVAAIYHAGNCAPPASATVFHRGNKEVIDLGTGYCVIFPVTYEDGSAATWYVNIRR